VEYTVPIFRLDEQVQQLNRQAAVAPKQWETSHSLHSATSQKAVFLIVFLLKRYRIDQWLTNYVLILFVFRLFYDTQHVDCSVRVTSEWRIGKDLLWISCGLSKILFLQLPGGTEENHENFSHAKCPDQRQVQNTIATPLCLVQAHVRSPLRNIVSHVCLQRQLATFSARDDNVSMGSATLSARDQVKSDIDSIIASECLYCGEMMIRYTMMQLNYIL
jgi:hypothetical protein